MYDPLWPLRRYSLFVRSWVQMADSVCEGRIAAGGDVRLQDCYLGTRMHVCPDRFDLLCGGHLVCEGGIDFSGNAGCSDTTPRFRMRVLNGVADQPLKLRLPPFGPIFEQLRDLSDWLGSLPANAGGYPRSGGLVLYGADRPCNRFVFDPEDVAFSGRSFEQLTHLTFTTGEWSTACITLLGPDIRFADLPMLGEVGGPLRAQRILWNLPQARQVQIENIAVKGSILCPAAHVEGISGSIQGSLVASSYHGTLHLRHAPFEGEVGAPSSL